jgi:hypothetical protein
MSTITSAHPDCVTEARPRLWRPGLAAGAVAAVATTAVAVGARALDVSLEAGGEAFPILGFAQLTVLFTVVGLGIASVLGRRADRPRAVWVKTAVALTALSFVPDLLLDADMGTKVTLMSTHVVAAAVVVPVVVRRLPERAAR